MMNRLIGTALMACLLVQPAHASQSFETKGRRVTLAPWGELSSCAGEGKSVRLGAGWAQPLFGLDQSGKWVSLKPVKGRQNHGLWAPAQGKLGFPIVVSGESPSAEWSFGKGTISFEERGADPCVQVSEAPRLKRDRKTAFVFEGVPGFFVESDWTGGIGGGGKTACHAVRRIDYAAPGGACVPSLRDEADYEIQGSADECADSDNLAEPMGFINSMNGAVRVGAPRARETWLLLMGHRFGADRRRRYFNLLVRLGADFRLLNRLEADAGYCD